MNKFKKKAFTLIELLVVIAIIAILAAILFPVFAQAKASAKKVSCLAQNKQIATASHMYSSDNDDVFPYDRGMDPGNTYYGETYVNGAMDPNAPTNWVRSVYPYIKNLSLYTCSVARDVDGNNHWGCFDPNGKPTTFCGSASFNAIAEGKTITAMPAPADTVIVSEKAQKQKVAQSIPSWNPFPDTYCPNVIGKPTTTRCPTGTDNPYSHVNHDLGANFCFADGHAAYKKKSAVKYSAFGWTGICRYRGNGTTPPNITNSDATLTSLLGIENKMVNGKWTYDNWNVVCDGSAF